MCQYDGYDEFWRAARERESTPRLSRCSLRRFNPRRAIRGAPAAEVEIEGEILWMDRDDIRKNRIMFGDLPGLVKADDHYESMQEYRGIPD